MNPRNIKIADYNYPLPDSRIAKYPLPERDKSKLLIYNRGQVSHTEFRQLPGLLPENSLLVMNNTRVILARLHFRKATGALIEVFCLEPAKPRDYALMFQQTGSCIWWCIVGNAKKWKEGSLVRDITVDETPLRLSCERVTIEAASESSAPVPTTAVAIRFSWDNSSVTWAQVLDACGELPIPPYLNRNTEESDLRTYQTVYSKVKGSVAAPTAGLHFTERVLADIDRRGIERCELTLHVGAGTFKPVKSELIEGHEMHSEWISVPRSAIEALLRHGAECTAVGTTSVRTLESLYYIGLRIIRNPNATADDLHIHQWEPYEEATGISPDTGNSYTSTEALQAILSWMNRKNISTLTTTTQIIIAPGYNYHIVRRIITNFHQPQSTLLLLVAAFVGEQRWRDIYSYALANDFRFLSYGDSSILIP
ncbi:MAG: S-adenosylmethionine:tRNA ribosyltransferase-isomerase [Bacteroidaceae bacterium]|nr:S-adenosylmethionine:tRNA ribosyltransferase-isomerase [Bacteroidaceae bacterium]